MKESALPKLAVSQQLTQQLELVIAGPEAAPLPRQYWHPLFTAVQINHSKLPVVLLPPRSDCAAYRECTVKHWVCPHVLKL
jgi:hypothetical protein